LLSITESDFEISYAYKKKHVGLSDIISGSDQVDLFGTGLFQSKISSEHINVLNSKRSSHLRSLIISNYISHFYFAYSIFIAV